LPSGGAYVPTGVIYADRLYLISDAGLVTCHRLDDGSIVWRKRLQGAFSASLVAGAGHLYAVSERGDVYVFKAADRFELVATNRLREPCLATPALAHGEVYLRSERFVYCIAKPIELAAEPASVAPTVDPAAIRSPADVEATSALVSPDAPSPALNATP
jgi:outer membrane protein assembly factor BamB